MNELINLVNVNEWFAEKVSVGKQAASFETAAIQTFLVSMKEQYCGPKCWNGRQNWSFLVL